MKAKIERKADYIAAKIKSSGIKPRVSIKGRIFFTVFHYVNRKGGMNPADSAYWKNKGWTDKTRPWKK